MSRLLCLLAISVSSLAACSGDDCGSPGSAVYGLVVSSDQVMLTYGDLMAGANNDCPASDAPMGVVSLTVSGTQMPGSGSGSGGGGLVTFCIPRPDQLGADQPLGSAIKIIDLSGADATCSYALDQSHIPTGSAHGLGVCSNGTDKTGFGLVFDGFLGLTRTCGTTVDAVSVGITGNVAVKPQ